VGLRSGGVAVRAVFVLYLTVILAGLVYAFVVGGLGQ
jgi:hypothetical protein